MSGTTDEQAAKEFCNRLRKKCGLRALGKLKKGIPLSQGCCPITNSLAECGVSAVNYDEDQIFLYPGGVEKRKKNAIVYTDPTVLRFLVSFDRGEYPHLEIPKATTMKIKKPNQRKATEVPL